MKFSLPAGGVMLALLAALGFAFKGILVKLAYPYGVSAVSLLALRMLCSLPVFLWVGWRERGQGGALASRDWAALVALGLAGYYGASLFDFLGLQYITAALERLILFTYPTLTLLLAFAFSGRRPQRREWQALLLCYAGIALAFWHDLRLGQGQADIWLGAGLVLLSALCYAGYLVGSGPWIARLGSRRFTALAMLVSSSAVLLHHALSEPLSALVQPWQVYALAAAMGLFSTVLPVFMQSAAIARIGAGRAALIGSVGPVITIGLGVLILGEPLTAAQIAGTALVMWGVRRAARV